MEGSNVKGAANRRGPTLDRYKASSLRAYNGTLPDRYDTSLALRVLRPAHMDDFILDILGPRIDRLAILDVGCATGRLLERMAEAGAIRLAGTDLAPRIVETARRRLLRFDLRVDLKSADAETRLPWPDRSFDAVTVTGVFHHFYAPEAAAAEIRRVLRPGGRLLIADVCFFPPIRELFNLCLRIHPHEGDYHFYTPVQLSGLLRAWGWDVHRSERINWWAFGIVAGAGRGVDTLAN